MPQTARVLSQPRSAAPAEVHETSVRHYNVRMIPQDLLEILACPACKQPLTLKPDGSALKCNACRRVYPVRDDIPILLIDEAKIEE